MWIAASVVTAVMISRERVVIIRETAVAPEP